MPKLVAGAYDRAENILHLWFPSPVRLDNDLSVAQFFQEVIDDWIAPRPQKAYLLVNFENLHIAAAMASSYADNIRKFQPLLLGTFRYNVREDIVGRFTRMAVTLGNVALAAPSHLFATEADARQAIRRAKEAAGAPGKR
jgi:hypothetical protein